MDNFEINSILNDLIEKICVTNYENNICNNKPDDIFIFELENHLDPDICNTIINKFDNDNRIYPGITGIGLNKNVKDTSDLLISTLPEWKTIDDILFKSLNDGIKLYSELLINNFGHPLFSSKNINDRGYQVQKYIKNTGFYNWHNDYSYDNILGPRIFTFIWYLNDVYEGGETFFLQGKIKPKKGKFVIFPSTWTYLHKGNVPISNDKYIITGWIYSKH